MAEDREVDAVLVEQGFERLLACGAGGTSLGGVPGAVAGDDDPGGDAAVDGGEVRGEPVELLVGGDEGAGVEVSA